MDFRHIAYIGVGSNIGDRAENCLKGIEAIDKSQDCTVEAQSPLYETEPVYLESQDWFVNAVARIGTNLEPEILFAQLKATELGMGPRPERVRFGPRILDLDILFYDDCIFHSGHLHIPHPRLHERRFVLKPLCDIAPELVHPVLGHTVKSLLQGLKDGNKKVRLYKCDY